MPNTAQQVYNQVIQALSPTERLQLATLILNELVKQDLPVIDHSDAWTDEDQIDIVNFSLQYAGLQFADEEAI